jgi:hypothetical protein
LAARDIAASVELRVLAKLCSALCMRNLHRKPQSDQWLGFDPNILHCEMRFPPASSVLGGAGKSQKYRCSGKITSF